MDNHEEEKEPLIAQSRAGEAGANLTDVLDALRSLVATWTAEGNFLTGANDHPQDKAVGKTYKECAKELKAILDCRVRGNGLIKIGAGIFQDHHFGKWPNCLPPKSEYEGEEYKHEAKDPYMVFEVEWTGRHWDCKADGYGMLKSCGDTGEYGNGSIFVSDYSGVKLITPNAPAQGCERSEHPAGA